MTGRPKRKRIPDHVKVQVCLRLLRHIGFLRPGAVEWDHFPALELRPINETGTDYDPPQHDPRYIQPLVKIDHALKTNGPKHDHSQGDKGKIAKVKRQERKNEEHIQRMVDAANEAKPPPQFDLAAQVEMLGVDSLLPFRGPFGPRRDDFGGRKPKRRIPSRPFYKRPK